MLAFSAFVYAKTLDTRNLSANLQSSSSQSNDRTSSTVDYKITKNKVNPAVNSNTSSTSSSTVTNTTVKDDSNSNPGGSASKPATVTRKSSTPAKTSNPVTKTSASSSKSSSRPASTTTAVSEKQEVSESNGQLFDTSKTSIGLLRVNYSNNSGKRIKLSVAKGGNTYYYNLQAKGNTEYFSLQMGSGQYALSILQNTSGSSYQVVASQTIDVNISDPLKVYLNSIQNVNWNSSMAAIVKAKALTSGMGSDADKVNAIYNFVISNIHYDNNKLSSVSTDYIPSIDSTLRSGTGICYDYASLFGAMLRGVGVPAKLVKGYTPNAQGYHAWNEVYYGGRWVVIDTTYDSQMKAANQSVSMIKSSSQYNKSREY